MWHTSVHSTPRTQFNKIAFFQKQAKPNPAYYRHFPGFFVDGWLRNASLLLETQRTQIPPNSSDCGWIQRYRNVFFPSKPPGTTSFLNPTQIQSLPPSCLRIIILLRRPAHNAKPGSHIGKQIYTVRSPGPTPSVFNIRVHSLHVIWSADARVFHPAARLRD